MKISAKLHGRLRKSWHLLRQRRAFADARSKRLVIEKAKWFNDAQSPVMFMVDDLTNAWHNTRGKDCWEYGGDWGGGLRRPGSAMSLLENALLSEHPDLKVTFFTVAGPISPYTHTQPFSHAAPLDDSDESRQFFSSLAENKRYELAYHGYDHGLPGVRSEEFVQEWLTFTSIDDAVRQTKRGLDIFVRATGIVPSGGKYGGWAYNSFSDEAISKCGFFWWCRDWTPRDVTGRVADGYYEPQMFGNNKVIALPSTIHGFYWGQRQIELLLARKQVIAVTEHIARVRPDGRVQTPNIVDDMHELRLLFRYLEERNVWYATGSEIASYVVARDQTLVYDVTMNSFSIYYFGRLLRPIVTLNIDCSSVAATPRPPFEIELPDHTIMEASAVEADRKRTVCRASIPVMQGRYHVRAKTG